MAALKQLLFVLLVFLVFASVGAEDEPNAYVEDGPSSDTTDSVLLDELRSRIQSLERQFEEKTQDIKVKDTVVDAKEKVIKEKLDKIGSLENLIASLQEKVDAVEEVGKANAKVLKFEKQVEELKRELDFKAKENDILESRLTGAERKASEFNSKLNSLQRIIDGQRTELHKTEHALRLAQEELTTTKIEATSKDMELVEVHSAWLPPWLGARFAHYQLLLEENWELHGKPALELLREKAIETKSHAEDWAAPHVETVKTKLVPAIKEHWVEIASDVEIHVQTVATKAIEICKTSKEAVVPHIITVVELVDPYFQELMEVSKPYTDKVSTAIRPHVDALHAALKPYKQPAVQTYYKFLELATTYHTHVQDRIEEKLKSHELTKALATKELIWFTASALLALPVLFLLNILSSFFSKKPQKPIRNRNSQHLRRKARRGHTASKAQKSQFIPPVV